MYSLPKVMCMPEGTQTRPHRGMSRRGARCRRMQAQVQMLVWNVVTAPACVIDKYDRMPGAKCGLTGADLDALSWSGAQTRGRPMRAIWAIGVSVANPVQSGVIDTRDACELACELASRVSF